MAKPTDFVIKQGVAADAITPKATKTSNAASFQWVDVVNALPDEGAFIETGDESVHRGLQLGLHRSARHLGKALVITPGTARDSGKAGLHIRLATAAEQAHMDKRAKASGESKRKASEKRKAEEQAKAAVSEEAAETAITAAEAADAGESVQIAQPEDVPVAEEAAATGKARK